MSAAPIQGALKVQCKCGWQGTTEDLADKTCPRCGEAFKAWPAKDSAENTLNQESWDVLERYLCSLTLNQEHHELSRIELSRRVDVDGYIFTPGTYIKESQLNQTSLK